MDIGAALFGSGILPPFIGDAVNYDLAWPAMARVDGIFIVNREGRRNTGSGLMPFAVVVGIERELILGRDVIHQVNQLIAFILGKISDAILRQFLNGILTERQIRIILDVDPRYISPEFLDDEGMNSFCEWLAHTVMSV